MSDTFTKVCNTCHVRKELDSFHRRKDTPDRRQYKCRECVRRERIGRGKKGTPMPDIGLVPLYTRVTPKMKEEIADLAEHRGTSINRTVFDMLNVALRVAKKGGKP